MQELYGPIRRRLSTGKPPFSAGIAAVTHLTVFPHPQPLQRPGRARFNSLRRIKSKQPGTPFQDARLCTGACT